MTPGPQDYTYFLEVDGAIKIGRSRRPMDRLRELQTGNHRRITLLGIIRARVEHHTTEAQLHERFRPWRLMPDQTEWFAGAIRAEVVAIIERWGVHVSDGA